MNKTARFVCGLLLPAVALGAQSPRSSDSPRVSEGSEQSIGLASSRPRELPDSPTPKANTDDNSSRLGTWRGSGDPGPFNFDRPEPSLGRAIRNPGVLTYSAVLAGLTAVQLRETGRCIDSNKPSCNLLFGKSRTATYAVNIPLTAGIILAIGRLKEKGNGPGMFLVMMAGLM